MHTKKTPKASVMVPLQNEFWLPAIQVPKKAGPIPCLQVDLLRFPVLLGPMALWVLQFLHALLQMDLFLRHQLHSDHHLNKVAVSTLPCKCLGHHSLGRGSPATSSNIPTTASSAVPATSPEHAAPTSTSIFEADPSASWNGCSSTSLATNATAAAVGREAPFYASDVNAATSSTQCSSTSTCILKLNVDQNTPSSKCVGHFPLIILVVVCY